MCMIILSNIMAIDDEKEKPNAEFSPSYDGWDRELSINESCR